MGGFCIGGLEVSEDVVVVCISGLLFFLLRQCLSTIGAVSLHVGKSPHLMFMLAKVEMREDSTSCLLVL